MIQARSRHDFQFKIYLPFYLFLYFTKYHSYNPCLGNPTSLCSLVIWKQRGHPLLSLPRSLLHSFNLLNIHSYCPQVRLGLLCLAPTIARLLPITPALLASIHCRSMLSISMPPSFLLLCLTSFNDYPSTGRHQIFYRIFKIRNNLGLACQITSSLCPSFQQCWLNAILNSCTHTHARMHAYTHTLRLSYIPLNTLFSLQ